MKTSIAVNKIVTEIIEVELPYYYFNDNSDVNNELCTYGMICEDKVVTINESKVGNGDYYNKIWYLYEVEKDPNLSEYTSIFNNKSIASNKSCFDAALDRAIKFIDSHRGPGEL